MSSVRSVEMKLVEQLFETSPGYVLDFSNPKFASFFAQELGVQIYDHRFSRRGTSKMNRLRCFLEVADDVQAAAALTALWEYRESCVEGLGADVPNGEQRLSALIVRLGGKPLVSALRPTTAPAEPIVSAAQLAKLRDAFTALIALQPQPRGLPSSGSCATCSRLMAWRDRAASTFGASKLMAASSSMAKPT